MLNVAIIGAGLMGRWHLAAARAAGVRIAAIVDPNLSAAEKLGRRAPGAALLPEISGLAALSVQAAHVCTPSGLHEQTAIALVEQGTSAFVEKPFAQNAAGAKVILSAARKTGAIVCPVHQYAFQSGIDTALAALPRLGRLHKIGFDICSAGAEGGRSARDSLIEEILPHPISILQRLRPDIPVARLSWSLAAPGAGECLAISQHDGVLISLYLSTNARPTRMFTQLSCERGEIDIDGFHGYAVVAPGNVSRVAKASAPFSRSLRHLGAASFNLAARSARGVFAYPGLQELTRRFYRAVAQHQPLPSCLLPDAIYAGALASDLLRSQFFSARQPEPAL